MAKKALSCDVSYIEYIEYIKVMQVILSSIKRYLMTCNDEHTWPEGGPPRTARQPV